MQTDDIYRRKLLNNFFQQGDHHAGLSIYLQDTWRV